MALLDHPVHPTIHLHGLYPKVDASGQKRYRLVIDYYYQKLNTLKKSRQVSHQRN